MQSPICGNAHPTWVLSRNLSDQSTTVGAKVDRVLAVIDAPRDETAAEQEAGIQKTISNDDNDILEAMVRCK